MLPSKWEFCSQTKAICLCFICVRQYGTKKSNLAILKDDGAPPPHDYGPEYPSQFLSFSYDFEIFFHFCKIGIVTFDQISKIKYDQNFP